jgi:hypothetical protein
LYLPETNVGKDVRAPLTVEYDGASEVTLSTLLDSNCHASEG